ncbi:MAG: ferrochelatase [Rickettsiaceae bacterium]|nr:ferrochelatase [Rickettsiaceae bacterium]
MSKIGKEKNNTKLAIVLFNLGGPDKLENIRPFLYNLFSDKWIIRVPYLVRKAIALFISYTRAPLAKKNYSLMGGYSPLLKETENQKNLLKEYLHKRKIDNFEIFISMRYWHPFSYDVIKNIKEFMPDKIIYLPLYPQCSSSTTVSSFEDFDKQVENHLPDVDVRKIGCYFNDQDFIEAHLELIKESLKNFLPNEKVKILFSAHSIPKKFVSQGDPYEWQINMTCKAINQGLREYNLESILCYQSKVGPIEWLAPSTEDVIEQCAKEGISMIVVPIAFVSEHIETLVELDIEYKLIAEKHGVKYVRVPALSASPIFIKALAKYISACIISGDKKMAFTSEKCESKFINCICRE